jgi:hypothetical protein
MFSSREDLKKKIQYYTSHEQERKNIAKSGQEKVLKYFTHGKIFKYMMNVIFEKILNNNNKEIPVMDKMDKKGKFNVVGLIPDNIIDLINTEVIGQESDFWILLRLEHSYGSRD